MHLRVDGERGGVHAALALDGDVRRVDERDAPVVVGDDEPARVDDGGIRDVFRVGGGLKNRAHAGVSGCRPDQILAGGHDVPGALINGTDEHVGARLTFFEPHLHE